MWGFASFWRIFVWKCCICTKQCIDLLSYLNQWPIYSQNQDCLDYKTRFCCSIENNSVPCEEWIGASDTSLNSMALRPSMIGDTTTLKRCSISDSRNCTTCACDYYVRYSNDGGLTWLGLSFGGVPGLGGTGCPGYGMTSATQTQALAWLQDEHINKEGVDVCLVHK